MFSAFQQRDFIEWSILSGVSLMQIDQRSYARMGFCEIAMILMRLQTIYADFGHLQAHQWDDFTEYSIRQLPSGNYAPNYDPHISHHKSFPQLLLDLMHHPHKSLEGIVFDIDLWSVWNKIKCPILIIHGHHSDILLREHIIKMRETHPDTTLIEINDAGHAPALLQQEEHEKIACWLA